MGTRASALVSDNARTSWNPGIHRQRAGQEANPDRPRDGLQDHHGRHFPVRFSDSILRCGRPSATKLALGKPLKKSAGCVTPDEAALSHRLFTAALRSHKNQETVEV